jgi:hypothetical protein
MTIAEDRSMCSRQLLVCYGPLPLYKRCKADVLSSAGRDDLDPQQDRLLWSVPAVFNVQLVIDESGQAAFKPEFGQVEHLVGAVLDGAVKTTFDIPRVGAQASVGGTEGSSASRTGANSIPTMALDDESLLQVCLHMNCVLVLTRTWSREQAAALNVTMEYMLLAHSSLHSQARVRLCRLASA